MTDVTEQRRGDLMPLERILHAHEKVEQAAAEPPNLRRTAADGSSLSSGATSAPRVVPIDYKCRFLPGRTLAGHRKPDAFSAARDRPFRQPIPHCRRGIAPRLLDEQRQLRFQAGKSNIIQCFLTRLNAGGLTDRTAHGSNCRIS